MAADGLVHVRIVDDGLRGVRNVLNDLRPGLLDDLGLLPALRSLVTEFGERHGAPVTFTAPDAIPVLSDEAEVAVFRAVQEALSNVARHAERAPVRVEVTTPPITTTALALMKSFSVLGLNFSKSMPMTSRTTAPTARMSVDAVMWPGTQARRQASGRASRKASTAWRRAS